MLIACQTCHRQYDVGDLQPGRKVRCYCGELNEVPQPRSRQADTLHCAACGGDVARDQKTCTYCDAPLTLAERGIGDACPQCYARLVKGARFCSGCGTPIVPQTISKVPSGQSCPRCDSPLSLCEIQGAAFTECTGCGGIWLEEKTFLQATESQEHSTVAKYFQTTPGSTAASDAKRKVPKAQTERLVQYLRCPVCGNMMNRKNFARCSGVIIDWCKGHGYWFDTHELEQVMKFIEGGGLEKARRRAIDDQKRELQIDRRKAAAQGRTASGRLPSGGAYGEYQGGRIGSGGSIIHILSELVWFLLR